MLMVLDYSVLAPGSWRQLHAVVASTRHLGVRVEALRCLGAALHQEPGACAAQPGSQ